MSFSILVEADGDDSEYILADECGDIRTFESAQQAEVWWRNNGGRFLAVQFIEAE